MDPIPPPPSTVIPPLAYVTCREVISLVSLSCTMAAASQRALHLQDAATCSICLECFTDPVSLDCGHSYCRPCITRYWDGADPRCPQCRSRGRNLRPNRELGCIAELIKLNVSCALVAHEDALSCPRHRQRLQLFCAQDHTLLCVVCRESREHKPHSVSPIEEAAQWYRGALHGHLEQLNIALQGLEQRGANRRRTAADLEENFKNQTEGVQRIFENLKEYLEKEKKLLLSRLEQEQEEKLKEVRGPLSHLEEQLTTHRDLLAAIVKTCEQPDAELLVNVPDILSRWDHVKAEIPQGGWETDQNTPSHHQHQDLLHEKIMELKESFPAELEWSYMKGFEREVTLDPDTAHRRLVLSEDGRSVRDGGREQDLPDAPQRFSPQRTVLGAQRLRSGRHYWEVEVGGATDWGLGVCDETVARKGVTTTTPEKKYWVTLLIRAGYYALTSPMTPLTPRVAPRVLGLFLDYEAGRLSVYNARDRALLFTFSGFTFPRTLRPIFYPEYSEHGKPAAAMRILPVTGRE